MGGAFDGAAVDFEPALEVEDGFAELQGEDEEGDPAAVLGRAEQRVSEPDPAQRGVRGGGPEHRPDGPDPLDHARPRTLASTRPPATGYVNASVRAPCP